MWMDIIDVHRFYTSGLGQAARQSLRRHIRLMWPNVRNMRVLSLGYADPYLDLFKEEAACLLAGMPAGQGAFCLQEPPNARAGAVFLTDETALPLPDRSIDRILLIHCLEASPHVWPMMRELWRVLADGGQLLILVPNRHNLWAQVDGTPFGNGSPYSLGQLNRLLEETMFTLEHSKSALFLPPFGQGGMLRALNRFDDACTRWMPRLGGVLLASASKQIYAATPLPVRQRRGAYVPVPHNRGPMTKTSDDSLGKTKS